MTQLEASHSTDLTGFPPDLTAPPRPAIPRRTSQLAHGTLADDPSTPVAGTRAFADPFREPSAASLADPIATSLADPTAASFADLFAAMSRAPGVAKGAAIGTPSCVTSSSPLSSPSGSPMIDADDDLDELDDFDDDELDDDELDELGGDDASAAKHHRPVRAAMFGPGLYAPAPAYAELAGQPKVALGAATLGERARRLGAQVVHKILVPVVAIAILVIAMGGTWSTAGATPTTLAAAQPGARPTAGAAATSGHSAGDEPDHPAHGGSGGKAGHHELTGKLNLNTATEDQLMVLPSVGPAKAERIVTWRKKNGGFKRTADLRRVKGFGYKTFKKLEPYLDIKGDTTLAPK